MLIIERRSSEELHVDGPAIVRVLGFRGDRVRLGIDAPERTTILRGELLPAATAEEFDLGGEG